MEPFYFGTPDEPLFGIYHPPVSEPVRDVGVLLCYPIGHEYIVSHRFYRQLSIRLAEAGFHVLRFDYYASGDSGGECELGSPGGGSATFLQRSVSYGYGRDLRKYVL